MQRTSEGRRDFLKTTLAGGMAAVIAGRLVHSAMAAAPTPVPAEVAAGRPKVALTNGNQRVDNVVRALKSLEKEIRAAIGSRRVVIKPNLVAGNKRAGVFARGRDPGDSGFSEGDREAGQCDHCRVVGGADDAGV